MKLKVILKHRYIYFLIIPALVYYIIFAYMPMYGLLLAFKEFNFGKPILSMPWAGLKHFELLFRSPQIWDVLINTIIISFGRIIFEFPAPIILALLLNEVKASKLKRSLQTVFTFPHFLSWVILAGILNGFLSSEGIINQLIKFLGGSEVSFLTDPGKFLPVLFITNIWKEFGWGSIIYLAAIAGINPELYEAAVIDGANRLQQIRYITWPSIAGTVAIMLVLSCGGILDGGFDQILNLYNPTVFSVADILDTYVFRLTLQTNALGFDFSTAVGLVKSVVSLVLLVIVNKVVTLMGQEGMF